ncbi:MAG: PQQ-binding-like beta-propeller repeat protein, partial [Caulobacteraceae bacterium]
GVDVLKRLALSAFALLAAGLPAAAAESPPPAPPPVVTSVTGPFTPVTDAMLKSPAPADWLMWRGNMASWGYSALNQISKANVKGLRMVWTRGLAPGLMEGTPLVHDGVLFMIQPNDIIQALDAGTGDLIWEYRRAIPEDLDKYIKSYAINRNIAIYGELLIDTSADDYIFALNARTGKLVWQTQILDYHKNPAQQTSGPLIVNGKAISGRGCEPKGGPDACVITAHDAMTGKELWRTHTIAKPGEPNGESWGDVPYDKRWHTGAWMSPSYDAETNLIYMGTSVTSPAPKFMLAGNDKQYLYHNSTLALDPDTGRIVWHYQHVVDHWDLDHPFERIIVDTAVAPDAKAVSWINPRLKPGERRKVVTGIPGKTGIVYTLDAKTGEFLWATPTTFQNVVSNIDGATGKVTVNPETLFTDARQTHLVCPSSGGGKNWPAGAYSPLTRMMYFPLANTCTNLTSTSRTPSLESLYAISSSRALAQGKTDIGVVQAISAETGRTGWKYEQRAGVLSLVATGGGLIFGGDLAGRFRAFDDRTGKVLWEVNLGAAVSGFPITFSLKGKQYVAVGTGPSVWGAGQSALTPEVRPSTNNALYVFALN